MRRKTFVISATAGAIVLVAVIGFLAVLFWPRQKPVDLKVIETKPTSTFYGDKEIFNVSMRLRNVDEVVVNYHIQKVEVNVGGSWKKGHPFQVPPLQQEGRMGQGAEEVVELKIPSNSECRIYLLYKSQNWKWRLNKVLGPTVLKWLANYRLLTPDPFDQRLTVNRWQTNIVEITIPEISH